MVQELNEMGVQVMVSVWPLVSNQSHNYNEMAEQNYLVQCPSANNICHSPEYPFKYINFYSNNNNNILIIKIN